MRILADGAKRLTFGLRPGQLKKFRTYLDELKAARPRLRLTAVEFADSRLEPRAKAMNQFSSMETVDDTCPAQAHDRGGGQ